MHLTLKLPLPLLRSQLEAALQSVVETVQSGIQIHPNGQIELHGDGTHLVSLIPVRIVATADWVGIGKRVLGGIPIPALLTFEIVVEFQTRIWIGPAWDLRLQSQVAYRWIRTPNTGLGLIPLPLKEIVAPLLERELRKIGRQVDEELPALAMLPQRIKEAWTTLQVPIQLDPPFALRLRPRQEPIPVSAFRVNGKALEVEAHLPIRGLVSLPGAQLAIPAVPLGEAVAFPQDKPSHLLLNLRLPWDWLSDSLSGETIYLNTQRLSLKLSWGTLETHGTQRNFSIRTRFRLGGLPIGKGRTLSGRAQLSWQWRMVPGMSIPDIAQLEVDVQALPPLMRLLWRIADKWALAHIYRGIREALQHQVQQIRQEVAETVAAFTLPTGDLLQGRINRLEFLDMRGETDGLWVQVRLSGEASVVLKEL